MSDQQQKIEADRQLLKEAQAKGGLAKLGAYLNLSGPGWLQSALTLGGGSLASSLYLGVVAGVAMLWLQPLAMILGIIMLSAIGYVTLSTGERPFRAINNHVNPVLGWSWLIASMLANMVWALPQYSLFYSVVEQNLLPSTFGKGGSLEGDTGKWVVSLMALVVSTVIVWSYGSGHWGVKLYEIMLKIVVALIVLCFVLVVVKIATSSSGLNWSEVLGGFIPNPRQLFEPTAGLKPLVDAISDTAARDYWTSVVVQQQREVMISAAATAVGINMTFLLPYSMLSKGWTREFRGLCTFDLSTGMLIPFMLATSCVVIASANQFNGKLPDGFEVVNEKVVPPSSAKEGFEAAIAKRQKTVDTTVTLAEQKVAAAMFKRDAGALAKSLEGLFGEEKLFAHIIFGFGVAAMALSTISLLMLISGFVVCELLDVPPTGWTLRIGCLAAATGVLWPVLWTGQAKFWLAIVASNFGMVLLPIAYITFFFLMNQKNLLKDDMPTGGRRLLYNALMLIAAAAATLAALWVVWSNTQQKLGSGWYGIGAIGALLLLTLVVHFLRQSPGKTES